MITKLNTQNFKFITSPQRKIKRKHPSVGASSINLKDAIEYLWAFKIRKINVV